MNHCKLDSKTHHGINILRGVFAILVVAAHSLDLAAKSFAPEFAETQIGKVLLGTLGNGFYWVMGFFVLSGFCIQLSVQSSYAKGCYSVRGYLAARVTRIAPLFYIALLFAATVELLAHQLGTRPPVWQNGINIPTFLGNVLFTQNITGWFGSYAPAWSITCEMAYYLFWPAALYLSDYRAARASIGAAIIAVILAAGIYILDRFSGTQYLVGVWMLLYLSVLWFAGAFVAAEWNHLSKSNLLRVLSHLWLPGLALVFLLEYKGFINFHVRNILLGPVFIGLLFNLRSWPDWLLDHKTHAETLGNISYPLYLLHGPLLVLMGTIMLFFGLRPGLTVAFFVLFLTSITVSGIFGIPLEVRLMAWRKNYLYGFFRTESTKLKDLPRES